MIFSTFAIIIAIIVTVLSTYIAKKNGDSVWMALVVSLSVCLVNINLSWIVPLMYVILGNKKIRLSSFANAEVNNIKRVKVLYFVVGISFILLEFGSMLFVGYPLKVYAFWGGMYLLLAFPLSFNILRVNKFFYWSMYAAMVHIAATIIAYAIFYVGAIVASPLIMVTQPIMYASTILGVIISIKGSAKKY